MRACGHCPACTAEQPYRCSSRAGHLRGPDDRRGFAVSTALPSPRLSAPPRSPSRPLGHENQLVVVPPELPFPQASILGCGTITGAGSVLNTAQVAPGESVAVIGLGGVGLNAVPGAAIAGAGTIIAIDRAAEKL